MGISLDTFKMKTLLILACLVAVAFSVCESCRCVDSQAECDKYGGLCELVDGESPCFPGRGCPPDSPLCCEPFVTDCVCQEEECGVGEECAPIAGEIGCFAGRGCPPQ